MTESCELCGRSFDASVRGRFAHLRAEHPAYARGLLLRLAAPVVFIVSMWVLSVAHAPGIAYVAALIASWGLLFMGKVRSRAERVASGARSTVPIARLLREGGIAFVLVVPIVAGVILLVSR